ncbi:MAG: hypothetical protein HYV63_28475 [Candidatus Schekmanbacteria bacterium]|nr:hypothetical protein [Candidatus Schekmanbacteria bacterium]
MSGVSSISMANAKSAPCVDLCSAGNATSHASRAQEAQREEQSSSTPYSAGESETRTRDLALIGRTENAGAPVSTQSPAPGREKSNVDLTQLASSPSGRTATPVAQASSAQTPASQCASGSLPPAMENDALHTAQTYMSQLRSHLGGKLDFRPLEKEVQLGGLVSRLMGLQSAQTRENVSSHLSWMRTGDSMAQHFGGQRIDGRSPQQWYRQIDNLRGVSEEDKSRLRTTVYSAFTLAGLRQAVSQAAYNAQRAQHGATTSLNLTTTRATFLRALTDELAGRSPRNLNFRETDYGQELLRRTGGCPSAQNLPRTIDPAGAKRDLATLEQFQSTKRGFGDVLWNRSALDVARQRAGAMNSDSLRHAIRSARGVVGEEVWRRILTASGLKPADVQ